LAVHARTSVDSRQCTCGTFTAGVDVPGPRLTELSCLANATTLNALSSHVDVTETVLVGSTRSTIVFAGFVLVVASWALVAVDRDTGVRVPPYYAVDAVTLRLLAACVRGACFAGRARSAGVAVRSFILPSFAIDAVAAFKAGLASRTAGAIRG
jgi:hypothetical protein